MTQWTVHCADILNASAEVLICSANPQLNLSGGVGAAFRLRYGDAMQDFLRRWLADRNEQFVSPGSIVVGPSCGSPFRAVIHAVAIDAFYDTSAEVIRETYRAAFTEVAHLGMQTIATACLACGYGRASHDVFLTAVRNYMGSSLAGIARVDFISTNADLVTAINDEIAKAVQDR